MPEWTAEQKQVIDSRGQNLLVSAAAGSGKTAVLVQRILEKIMGNASPVDLDRLLVVTFTNAAAASLREKIRARLEEEASGSDPVRVQTALRQLSMLAADHIETIDRFCREIVLDHADALGIDPSFRIADEGELRLLQSEAVSQIIEEAYDDPDPAFREAFLDFSALYAPGRTDEGLEDLILDFYAFSMSHEFPRMWRQGCVDLYRGGCEESEWKKDLEDRIRIRLDEIHESLIRGLAVCAKPQGPYHYVTAMQAHEELVSCLMACGSMQELAGKIAGFDWPRPGAKKRGKNAIPVDSVLEAYVKDVRDRAKKELQALEKKFFFAPEEQIESMRLGTFRYMEVLAQMTDRFEERFTAQKEERGIADFSDVAHWALRVLISMEEDGTPKTDADGNYLRTALAEEYADYFQEIYIDEYQDSNRVQEILLQSISRPGGRFMVGDMKQSIYRFRMADTGIFLDKARTYSPDSKAPSRRIDLHRNFRSRAQVLDAVNLIFRQVMRAEMGGVDYTTEQELRPGYPFPEAGEINDDLVPELILAEPDDVPGVRGKVQAEATAVAQRILGLVGKLMIYDKENGSMRPCTFGDITILLRTAAGWAETFSRVLDEHGIPNRPDASTGYFDAVEVRTILSYLNVLDNPRQDIPLAASLRSQIGQLEDRELAVIRQEEGDGQFYDCILAYARCGKDPVIRGKLVSFLEMTKHLRSLVKDTPIHILLWRIFDESGYEDRIAALEGGRQKKANLELLVDMAMAYEETSYRGLFHFVRYIEKLRKAQKDIGQASGGTGRENLVRIMTMHKSKGLEFPVVFVCGLNKRFNQQDARGRIVMHEHLGAGLDYRDAALRTKTENRIRSAIAARITTDALGEELRVLYVAMTRAEQKLILTGCMDSRKKAVEKAMSFRACTEEKLPVSAIESAGCMLDWVLASLSRIALEQDFFDSGQWEGPQLREEEALDLPGSIRILTGVQVLGERAVMERKENRRLQDLLSQNPDQAADPALRERLESMLCHTYAWSGGRDHMPGKMSVSEIKHDAYEAELRRLAEEEGTLPAAGLPGSARARTTLEPDAQPGAGVAPESLPAGEAAAASMQMPDAALIEPPAFLREEAGGEEISGTAMGSAYHLVLAELDYEKHRTKEQVEALLETMLNCDKIQKREAARLDTGKIVRFVTSRLAERMRAAAKAGKLWREQPFVIAKNAGAVRPGWSNDEQILLQGIIDAFFIEEDGIVLVDYKTDRAKPGEEESLVRRYRVQFALYRDALEMLLGQPVKEAWLYSLSLHKAVQVALAPRQDTPAGTSESAAN